MRFSLAEKGTKMAELKPCPFCGGEAVLEHDYCARGYSYVRCGKCGVKGFMFCMKFNKSSDEEAIEAWNRRYTPSEIDFDYEAED